MNTADFDIQVLAYRAMGRTVDEAYDAIEELDIDEELLIKYEVSFSTYAKIIRDLAKFTPKVLFSSMQVFT